MQTALLANAINIAKHTDDPQNKVAYSGSGVLNDMDAVFFAAERIPAEISASEAASQLYAGIKNRDAWPKWALRD